MQLPRLLVFFLFSVALLACGDRTLKSGVVDPFPPRFTVIKERILLPKCGKCHSLVESHKLLMDGWVIPGNAAASELYEATEGGSMPPYGSKLLDEEIEGIRQWIDAGAPLD